MSEYREWVKRTLESAAAAERAKDQQQQQADAAAQERARLHDFKQTLRTDAEVAAFNLGVLAARQGGKAGG